MSSPLIWLVPVIVVAVLMAVITTWAARPRKPLGMFNSMDAHHHFVDALSHTCDPDAPAPAATADEDAKNGHLG